MIIIREILFRGKEKETNKWVYGYLLADTADCSLKKEGKCFCAHDGSLCWILEWDDAFHEYDEKEVIPETVSQYTGLIDKNGNKIFEGDVCTIRVPQINGNIKEHKEYVCVFDNNACFWFVCCNDSYILKGTSGYSYPETAKYNIEVIGNIYDQQYYK